MEEVVLVVCVEVIIFGSIVFILVYGIQVGKVLVEVVDVVVSVFIKFFIDMQVLYFIDWLLGI